MSSFLYTTAIDKIRNMTARKKVIQGGSSAGKTFGIIPILIDRAIKNPLYEITIIGQSVPHLKSGAMKDFLKIMKMTKRYIPSNWNISDRVYTFTNGSTISFVNADGDKAIGPRRNCLYINEANLIDYNTYNQLAIRTSDDIFIDYNPVNKFWVHNEVLTEDDSELLILTYKDNEALSDTIVKELLSKRKKAEKSEYWKNWCKVYIDGEIGQLEGVIYNYNEIDYIPEDAELLGIGLDFGYTNDPAAAVAVYKYNNEILLDEIFYLKGLSNRNIANLFITNGYENDYIYADSAEPKSIDEIKSYGLNIYPTKKGSDSILYGISLLQDYDLFVTKRSVNLKNELDTYNWKKDKEGNSMNIPVEYNNHACDAIRYVALVTLRNIDNSPMLFF